MPIKFYVFICELENFGVKLVSVLTLSDVNHIKFLEVFDTD